MRHAPTLIASALLAACGAKAPEAPPPAAPPALEEAEAGLSEEAVAPAIIPPDEVADPAEPPSYEVAIASAAAQHNRELERCSKQPQRVRAECEQAANAAFDEARQGLEDLRGVQQ